MAEILQTLPVEEKKARLRALLDTHGRGTLARLARYCGQSDRSARNWPKPGKPWVPAKTEQKIWEFFAADVRPAQDAATDQDFLTAERLLSGLQAATDSLSESHRRRLAQDLIRAADRLLTPPAHR